LERKVVMRHGGRVPEKYCLSSEELIVMPGELRKAHIKATDRFSTLIDDFGRGFQDWYQLNDGNPTLWECWTRKLKDPKWRGPEGAKLFLDVKSFEENVLVFTFNCNQWDAFPGKPVGMFSVEKKLQASKEWQTISVGVDELLPAGTKKGGGHKESRLENWRTVTEFCIGGSGKVIKDGASVGIGAKPWKGPREFRNLRWEGGVPVDDLPVKQAAETRMDVNEFNNAIKKSLDQEKLDRK